MKYKTHQWWKVARKEGRLCRICREPMSKRDWENKEFDKLCWICYVREKQLPHNDAFRLGHDLK